MTCIIVKFDNIPVTDEPVQDSCSESFGVDPDMETSDLEDDDKLSDSENDQEEYYYSNDHRAERRANLNSEAVDVEVKPEIKENSPDFASKQPNGIDDEPKSKRFRVSL